MFNLNQKYFEITKENIFRFKSSEELYHLYINKIQVKGKILSPLRNERDPSFSFFYNNSNELLWKDFILGSGDIVHFVRLMFNINYYEALIKLIYDAEIDNNFKIRSIYNYLKINKNDKNINVEEKIINIKQSTIINYKSRDWTNEDISFWKQFGISLPTLKFYNVLPVEYMFFDGNPIYQKKLCYVFIEYKDNNYTYKYYKPYNKEDKWYSTQPKDVWQGWTQLKEKGETLIITKSRKDVMSIVENTPYNSVALGNEGIIPKSNVVNELKNRFNYIYLLYDNDFDKEENWGRICGSKIANIMNIQQIEIPDKYKSKDFSDLIKNIKVLKNENIKDILNNKINVTKK